MAPDRGLTVLEPIPDDDLQVEPEAEQMRPPTASGEGEGDPPVKFLPEGHHFTIRGVVVGLLVGLVIVFSNMYFGLQTGWVSMMTMPASLLGFGIFRTLSRHLSFPFSPVENVLVQSVAGGMAIMPLGCGFVGVVSLALGFSNIVSEWRLQEDPNSMRFLMSCHMAKSMLLTRTRHSCRPWSTY